MLYDDGSSVGDGLIVDGGLLCDDGAFVDDGSFLHDVLAVDCSMKVNDGSGIGVGFVVDCSLIVADVSIVDSGDSVVGDAAVTVGDGVGSEVEGAHVFPVCMTKSFAASRDSGHECWCGIGSGVTAPCTLGW